MYIPVETLLALALFGGFMWWLHLSEMSAKKNLETRNRQLHEEYDRRELARKPKEKASDQSKEKQPIKSSNQISN